MIKIITGPMFSGKSKEILKEIKKYEEEGKKVIALKPATDTRDKEIKSRDGQKRECELVISEVDTDIIRLKQVCLEYDVIAIDEVQFFSTNFIKILIKSLNINDKIVLVSGLDMDRFGEPFGSVPYVLSVADEIVKKKARCTDCHKAEVANTEYMESLGGDLILIGDTEYIALCKECRESRLKKIIEENDLHELYNRGFLKEIIIDNQLAEIVSFGKTHIVAGSGRKINGSININDVLFFKEGLIFNKNKKYY
jgi:thymidine kinase